MLAGCRLARVSLESSRFTFGRPAQGGVMKKALALAVSMLLFDCAMALAQRTSVSRDFPIYDNQGKPDLTPDPKRFVSQMEIVDRLFQAGDCELVEGSVGGTGYRRLLRFDTVILNAGNADLVLGNPSDPNNPNAIYFELATCHHHYHFKGFSNYQLLRLDG